MDISMSVLVGANPQIKFVVYALSGFGPTRIVHIW